MTLSLHHIIVFLFLHAFQSFLFFLFPRHFIISMFIRLGCIFIIHLFVYIYFTPFIFIAWNLDCMITLYCNLFIFPSFILCADCSMYPRVNVNHSCVRVCMLYFYASSLG